MGDVKTATCACGAKWEVKKLQPHHACSTCQAIRRLAWRKAHPMIFRALHRKWRRENVFKARAAVRKWKAENPERVRFHNKIAKRNYRKKEKLLNERLIAELPCMECGVSHAQERRIAVIRRTMPATVEEIREAWPCFWLEEAGFQRLRRDLKKMGAQKNGRIWQLARQAA